jgi:hypothetical protein
VAVPEPAAGAEPGAGALVAELVGPPSDVGAGAVAGGVVAGELLVEPDWFAQPAITAVAASAKTGITNLFIPFGRIPTPYGSLPRPYPPLAIEPGG